MNKEFNIEKYEYKNPSYDLRENNVDFNVFNDEISDTRYFKVDEQWESKGREKKSVNILLTGDLLCQEFMIEKFRTNSGRFDFKLCFDYVRPLLKSSDFAVGNLETPISETAPYRGEILTHEGPFYCNAPIEYLDALKYAGFDMLTTANNHTLDAGVRGLYDTVCNTKKFDFIQTGTFIEEKPKYEIVNIKGFKVGFTAFSFEYNTMDLNLTPLGKEILINDYSKQSAKAIYREMKKAGAEYVICIPHWGKEFTNIISKKQIKVSKELVEIGYDAIIGHHSHVVQKFAYINNVPVAYSLGNLITHMNHGKERVIQTQHPVICVLNLERDNKKISSKINFIPCKIVKDVEDIPFQIIPINKKLTYSENIRENIKGTTEVVKKMLEVDNTRIVNNFNINLRELFKMKKVLKTRKSRVSQLVEFKESSVKKSCRKVNEQLDENVIKKGNVYYALENGSAKIIDIKTQANILRLRKDIEGLPIKAIDSNTIGNTVTRLVYTGSAVEYIGKYAFSGYEILESIRLYDKLLVIDDNAFENCIKMTGIVIPKSLNRIGKEAFKNCKSLMSIKIPSSVKKIGKNAFEGCKDLTIFCEEDSYAYKYASENNIRVKFMPL